MMSGKYAAVILLLLASLISACGGSGSAHIKSGTTEVTVALEAPSAGKAVFKVITSSSSAYSFQNYTSKARIPAGVAAIVITVTGAEFDPMVFNFSLTSAAASPFPKKLSIPNGKDRTITIECKNTDGTVLYSSKATIPMLDGTPVTVPMSVTSVMPLGKLYGGGADDNDRSLSRTKDDGYFIFGNTRSFSAPARSQVLAYKLKSNGDVYWQKVIGPAAPDQLDAKGLATSDGGFVLGGKLIIGGSAKLSFSKFDGTGSLLWQSRYNGVSNRESEITDYRQTPDGGYIIAANTTSYYPGTGPWYNDFWILKLNSAGTVEWHTTIRVAAGNRDNRFGTIQSTSDGGYMLVGVTESNLPSRSLCMVKLDAAGNVTWSRVGYKPNEPNIVINAPASYKFVPFLPSGDGGHIVIADIQVAGVAAALIFKTDASGTVIWQKIYGKNLGFTASSLVSTDGGFIVYGSYTAGGILAFKIDAQGNVVWDKKTAVTATQTGQILQNSDGSLMTLNSKQLDADWDIWLLKINAPSASELAIPSTLDVTPTVMAPVSPGLFTVTQRTQAELGLPVIPDIVFYNANSIPKNYSSGPAPAVGPLPAVPISRTTGTAAGDSTVTIQPAPNSIGYYLYVSKYVNDVLVTAPTAFNTSGVKRMLTASVVNLSDTIVPFNSSTATKSAFWDLNSPDGGVSSTFVPGDIKTGYYSGVQKVSYKVRAVYLNADRVELAANTTSDFLVDDKTSAGLALATGTTGSIRGTDTIPTDLVAAGTTTAARLRSSGTDTPPDTPASDPQTAVTTGSGVNTRIGTYSSSGLGPTNYKVIWYFDEQMSPASALNAANYGITDTGTVAAPATIAYAVGFSTGGGAYTGAGTCSAAAAAVNCPVTLAVTVTGVTYDQAAKAATVTFTMSYSFTQSAAEAAVANSAAGIGSVYTISTTGYGFRFTFAGTDLNGNSVKYPGTQKGF